jgi:hypothetical protein
MFEFACDKCGKSVIVEDLSAIVKNKAKGLTSCPHCHACIADEKIVACAKSQATEMINTALDSLQARRTHANVMRARTAAEQKTPL